MSSERHNSSRADSWLAPRPYSDPSLRLRKYGRIRSMDEEPGLLRRLFSRF